MRPKTEQLSESKCALELKEDVASKGSKFSRCHLKAPRLSFLLVLNCILLSAIHTVYQSQWNSLLKEFPPALSHVIFLLVRQVDKNKGLLKDQSWCRQPGVWRRLGMRSYQRTVRLSQLQLAISIFLGYIQFIELLLLCRHRKECANSQDETRQVG